MGRVIQVWSERERERERASSSDALAPSSFLFLVVRPGATSSVLAPSSDVLCFNPRMKKINWPFHRDVSLSKWQFAKELSIGLCIGLMTFLCRTVLRECALSIFQPVVS